MSAKPGPKMTKAPHNKVEQVVSENSQPFVTTANVVGEFEASRRTVRKRLHDLRDDGRIRGREVGANCWIWWPPDQVAQSSSANA
jgi:hypothetical protein